jgi:hypothetical protein
VLKAVGNSEESGQGLSSSLEQNLERELRILARRATSTAKGFYGFLQISAFSVLSARDKTVLSARDKNVLSV